MGTSDHTVTERGATALEFAVIFPVFVALLIGVFYLCMLLAVAGNLHAVVADAARCASVKPQICASSASTVAYAQSHFYLTSMASPTFTYSTPQCGHAVTASVSFVFNLGLSSLTVPLSATSCFP